MMDKLTSAFFRASQLCVQGKKQSIIIYSGYRNFYNISSTAQIISDSSVKSSEKSEKRLNSLFWSKPCSLALSPDSPLRFKEPNYEGIRRIILKLLLFYSRQSKSIRGANAMYRRIISQVDEPAIYDVFLLAKTFKTTFALLILHMWLCLRRMKAEGKDGIKFGQYLYEIYNHDLELRVSKAGVNMLLGRWMKDLEKVFYGNIIAYDAALLPDAKSDALSHALWRCKMAVLHSWFHIHFLAPCLRNVFADDAAHIPSDDAVMTVQAMSRYISRESTCLSLTDKDALFSGNFMFTSLRM